MNWGGRKGGRRKTAPRSRPAGRRGGAGVVTAATWFTLQVAFYAALWLTM
jgi:hypothetical protein